MNAEELRRAIEGPGAHAGLGSSPGWWTACCATLPGSPGALPLLSHGLLETWKRRSADADRHGYRSRAACAGAIARTAEGVYDALRRTAALARAIFLRLTELGEGTEDTRRRVPSRSWSGAGSGRRVERGAANARRRPAGDHQRATRSRWPTRR